MSNLKIFQNVKTPDGDGVLIGVSTPANLLRVEYAQAECDVWFGPTGNSCTKTYPLQLIEELNDITKFKKPKNYDK